MKTKRPYTKRIAARSANEQLLKDCHDVMTDAINDWETPDSPEAFCWSMKGLMVHRDRIAARLGLASESDCVAAAKADEKRERSAENVDALARGTGAPL